MRKKAIILLLVLCACQNSICVKPSQTNASITDKEKKILEKFFRILIFEEDFGYVLLGAKPVSTSFYLKIVPKTNNWFDALASFTKTNRIMRNGWEIWKKHYSCPWFWDEPSSQSPNHFHLILANPERVREVVERYQEDFKTILGKKVSGDEILAQRPFFHKALADHEVLKGILLGYGSKNAWFFYKTRCIEKKCPFLGRWEDRDESLPLPSFVMDPHDPEAKKLKESYEMNRKAILEYYEGKDFLEATLALLARSRQDCLLPH